MKAFNKLFSLVVASVLVFSLAGCGDKEESKKFSLAIFEQKFVDTTLNCHYLCLQRRQGA